MIAALCEKLHFPAEAAAYLTNAWKELQQIPQGETLLQAAEDKLYAADAPGYAAELKKLYEKTELHPYTVDMLFYLRALKPLRAKYAEKGLPEELYWAAAEDLRYKLMECRATYGIWGTFVHWFDRFYLLTRFALGRLQFETISFPGEDIPGLLSKGDPVLNCHIPSGSPLKKEAVLDSLRQAYAFFPELRRNGVLPVTCGSWLLYEPFRELYPEGSNLRAFYDLFRVGISYPRGNETDFNRVFGCNWTPELDLDTVPQETALQKNIIAYLKSGGSFGVGQGMLLFDGEKVI